MTSFLTHTFAIFMLLFAASVSLAAQSEADKLMAVWQYPEYQAFVENLKPWVPSLTKEEQKMSTKKFMELSFNQAAQTFMPMIQLFMQEGLSEQTVNTFFTEEKVSQIDEFIRLSGNLFINEKIFKELSIYEFSSRLDIMGMAGLFKYVCGQTIQHGFQC